MILLILAQAGAWSSHAGRDPGSREAGAVVCPTHPAMTVEARLLGAAVPDQEPVHALLRHVPGCAPDRSTSTVTSEAGVALESSTCLHIA